MPKLISGSTLRRGGSGEFLDLRGSMPQLPPTDTTATGFTLATDELYRTTYRSSLGFVEFNSSTMWSSLPDGTMKLVATGTGVVKVLGNKEAISTTTATLVVEGGIGISGGIWTGKDIHVNNILIGQGFEGFNNIVIQGPTPAPDQDYEYPDGQENVAIGWDALKNINQSLKSIAIGRNALGSGTNISRSIAIGDSALQHVGTLPPVLIKSVSSVTQFDPIAITSVSNDNPVVVTAPGHTFSTGTRVTVTGVNGLSTGTGMFVFSLLNMQSFFVDVLTADTVALYNQLEFSTSTSVDGNLSEWSAYVNSGTIYCPVEVSVADHGFTTSTAILFRDVEGATELNYNVFYAYPLTTSTFQVYKDNIVSEGYIEPKSLEFVGNGVVYRRLLKNNNIAVGTNAGTSLYDGEQNFFFGDNIAPNLTTGSYNFFMGHDVATYMTRGSGNVSIMGDNLVDGQDNQVNIGGIFYYNGDGYLQLNADTGLGLGTNSTSSTTGALVVYGGAGILNDLWVGGNIYGTIQYASTATNLKNGSTGSLAVQTSPGVTEFIEIGGNGTVLSSNGVIPFWTTTIGSSNALNAEQIYVNVANSGTYYLGMVNEFNTFTGFNSSSTITFSPDTQTFSADNILVTSSNYSTSTTTGQALTVTGGIGVQEHIYVNKSVYSQDGNSDENYLVYSPKVTVSVSPPNSPRIGDTWIDGSSGIALQWVKDGTDTFWLQVGTV